MGGGTFAKAFHGCSQNWSQVFWKVKIVRNVRRILRHSGRLMKQDTALLGKLSEGNIAGKQNICFV